MRPDLHLTQPQPSSPLTILHGGVAAISKQQQQQQQRKLQLNIELRKCKGEGDVEGEGEGEEGGDERLMKLAPPSHRVGKLKIFSILRLYANYRSI